MLIHFNTKRSRFEAEFGFDEFRVSHPLVKEAGFKFDGNSSPKVWHTNNYNGTARPMLEQAKTAAKLRQYCDEEALRKLDETLGATPVTTLVEQRQVKAAQIAASRADNSDAVIPVPSGLKYLPYQRAGIAYAMSREAVLIADEMGLGKTIQAIGISNADANIKKVLVVCPATPKINWMKEWKKWDVKGMSVGIANVQTGIPGTDVVITNYEQLAKLPQMKEMKWDLLVVDECHKVKNPKAQRTQYLLGAKATTKKVETKTCACPGKKCRKHAPKVEMKPMPAIEPFVAGRRAFLTGTPIVNRPLELWPLVENLDPTGLGASFWNYVTRYCAAKQTRYGWDFTGASNLDELQSRLRSTFMVRRLKKDVLKELPPKRRKVEILEADERMRELITKEKTAYEALEQAKKEGKDKLSTLSIAMTEMSAARKAIALEKVPSIIEYAEDLLENESKLVIMVHHDDVVQALAQHFGKRCVTLNSRTPMKDRDPNVVRFQTDATCEVFVGTIQAAGVAITLTKARVMLFGELDWVPGNVSQAEDRIHRIGQNDNVLIIHLVVDDSLDANMVEKIIDKQSVIDAGLDNKTEIEKAAEQGIAPEMPKVGVTKAEDKPKKLYGRDGKELPVLTESQVAAVHEAMQYLRSRCDGAVEDDGKGFSGTDKTFGWALAAAVKLSPKMAAYGQRLVRKYQGQLGVARCLAAGVEPKMP